MDGKFPAVNTPIGGFCVHFPQQFRNPTSKTFLSNTFNVTLCPLTADRRLADPTTRAEQRHGARQIARQERKRPVSARLESVTAAPRRCQAGSDSVNLR